LVSIALLTACSSSERQARLSECNDLSLQTEKNNCYFDVATDLKDESICKKIVDQPLDVEPSKTLECMSGVETMKFFTDHCEAFTDKAKKEECYNEVKESLRSPSS
jgi:hypothetical protein